MRRDDAQFREAVYRCSVWTIVFSLYDRIDSKTMSKLQNNFYARWNVRGTCFDEEWFDKNILNQPEGGEG